MNLEAKRDRLLNGLWAIGYVSMATGLFILSPAWAFVILGAILIVVSTAGMIL